MGRNEWVALAVLCVLLFSTGGVAALLLHHLFD